MVVIETLSGSRRPSKSNFVSFSELQVFLSEGDYAGMFPGTVITIRRYVNEKQSQCCVN